MKNYSKNKKLNSVLNTIEEQLKEMGVDEVKRYCKEFPNEPDYNIVQYGNLLVYYYDIYKLYENCGYKSTNKYSLEKIWETYKRQVGFVAKQLLKNHN